MPQPFRLAFASLLWPLLAAGLLLANALQMLSLAFLPLSPALFRYLNRRISGGWFGLLRISFETLLRVEVRQTGTPLPWRENAFLIANHQAMADIPILVALAARSGRMGDLKWFVKDPLKWVPGIGWGMRFLDCLFVKRNWTADREMVERVFARIREKRIPFWIVSFLEGTRATPAKLARSQAFARKQGLPHLEYVMVPRTKGFEATLQGLHGANRAIYDATIAYEEAAPSLTRLFFGPVKRVHVHTRRYTEWPVTAEERARWITERFVEKDKLLAHFHAQGSFPDHP
jgi:1-acyl-sn-glycerol-3-phosphate acyltransferase